MDKILFFSDIIFLSHAPWTLKFDDKMPKHDSYELAHNCYGVQYRYFNKYEKFHKLAFTYFIFSLKW